MTRPRNLDAERSEGLSPVPAGQSHVAKSKQAFVVFAI